MRFHREQRRCDGVCGLPRKFLPPDFLLLFNVEPFNRKRIYELKMSLFLHFEWREEKKVAKCNLASPTPPTRGSSKGKTETHYKRFRIDTHVIQRLCTDHMNLTIIHELRKVQ